MSDSEPWGEVLARTVELSALVLHWQGSSGLDPDEVAAKVIERLQKHPLPEGVAGWLNPRRKRRLIGFIRHAAWELRREREAALGGKHTRSLEPGLPVEGREPVPGGGSAADPGAAPEEIAARIAALTAAQARLVGRLLDGEEVADIATTLGTSPEAVRHMALRAVERVASVGEVRRPPPGDFPGPFTGRRSHWNRTLYLHERDWTPEDLATDEGVSREAIEKRLHRIQRALASRPDGPDGGSRPGKRTPPT